MASLAPHAGSAPATAGKRREALDFPATRFFELCRQAREWGVRKLVLIGEGEPLLHPALTDMVAAAKAAACEVVLLTNGTLIDPSCARELVASGLDELRLSLWASNPEEYVAQYPGTDPVFFHRTVQGARQVVSAKRAVGSILPRIVMHRPIDPRFYRTLGNTLELAGVSGCDAVSFSPLKPLLEQDRERLLNAEQEQELIPLLRRLARTAKGQGLGHNTGEVLERLRIGRAVRERLPCYIGWTDMRIRVNGDVVPCDTCVWIMGNIHGQDLREIWNGPAYREFRRWGRDVDGTARSGPDCLCDYCCHAVTNARLQRFLRWCPARSAA